MERELLQSGLEIRNVIVSGRRTSMRLEPDMWDALAEICRREHTTVHELCSRIDGLRRGGSLTSATRVYVMRYFRRAAAEQGAGHGEGGTEETLRRRLAASAQSPV